MLASDNAPGNFSEDERLDTGRLPVIERFIDKNAYIGVLRLKRDVGAQSTIGMLATTYNFIEKHNQLLGIDGRIVTNPQTVITFQAIGTSSRRCFFNPSSPLSTIAPGAPCYNGSATTRNQYRTGNGFGYTWTYDVTKRNYGWFVGGYGRTQRLSRRRRLYAAHQHQRGQLSFPLQHGPQAQRAFYQLASHELQSHQLRLAGTHSNLGAGCRSHLQFR